MRFSSRVCAVLVLLQSVLLIASAKPSQKKVKNVILLISDGFGPASETFGRTYFQAHREWLADSKHSSNPNQTNGAWIPLLEAEVLPLDTIQVGASRTRSSDSWVTDSAAGATAFSCAQKSYNAAIAVDPLKRPCGTVLEAAKLRGMKTGLVATSRITHATPAAFSAHVVDRDMEDDIAEYQVGLRSAFKDTLLVDLMFGGGRCHFIDDQSNHSDLGASCRHTVSQDGTTPWNFAMKRGYELLSNRQQFDALDNNVPLPVMGLFHSDHMSYEIDRDPKKEPSLLEMSQKALSILEEATKDSENGFFLMIEGSRIDMAAHSNDPATHANEILMYQTVIDYVKKFVANRDDSVMISVADHETGGLALGRQLDPAVYPDYNWYPEVLFGVRHSVEYLVAEAKKRKPVKSGIQYFTCTSSDEIYVREVLFRDGLGISNPSSQEVGNLISLLRQLPRTAAALTDALADAVSRRAQVGWSTHGHSGVDVNLYAFGVGAEELRGNHENTDIGKFIAKSLNLDLDAVTRILRGESSTSLAHVSRRPSRSVEDHRRYKTVHYHMHV